jgi:hypothetical protein
VAERITALVSASGRNLTVDILFIIFPPFGDKTQTQNLPAVGAEKNTKAFLKNLGLSRSS